MIKLDGLPTEMLSEICNYNHGLLGLNRKTHDPLYQHFYEEMSSQPGTLLHGKLFQVKADLPVSQKIQGAVQGALDEIKKYSRFIPKEDQMRLPTKFDFKGINRLGDLIQQTRKSHLLEFNKNLQEVRANPATRNLPIYVVAERLLRRNSPVSKKYIDDLPEITLQSYLLSSAGSGKMNALHSVIDSSHFAEIDKYHLATAIMRAVVSVPEQSGRVINAIVHSGRFHEIDIQLIVGLFTVAEGNAFNELVDGLLISGRYKEIDWSRFGEKFNLALNRVVAWGHEEAYQTMIGADRLFYHSC